MDSVEVDDLVSMLLQAAREGKLPPSDKAQKMYFEQPAGIGGFIEEIERALIAKGIGYWLWENKGLPGAHPFYFSFPDQAYAMATPWLAAQMAGLGAETVQHLRQEHKFAVDVFAGRIRTILKESYQLEPEEVRSADERGTYRVYMSYPCARRRKARPIVDVHASEDTTWSVSVFMGSLDNVNDSDASLTAYSSTHLIKRSAEDDAADLAARYIKMSSQKTPHDGYNALLNSITYRR